MIQLLFLLTRQYNYCSYWLGNSHTANICEGETEAISCSEAGTAIDITSATYGRSSTEICVREGLPSSKTDCQRGDERDLELVKSACDGESSCELFANNGVFGDPCRGTYKYLEVTFSCIPGTCLYESIYFVSA